MDPTYSPAALPQNCDRIFQVGGCEEMLDSRTMFCCHLWFCCLQTGTLLCAPGRSLRRTTFIFASALCWCFVWALVAGSVTCWHRWKIALYIIRFLSVTIFDILHSNWSNQVKFWMSSKGCCKSTWVCLCALVLKLTKRSFYWSNCCHMQLLLKKQMWMTIFDVALNHNMAHNSVPADGCLMYCMKFQLWLPSGSLSLVDQ